MIPTWQFKEKERVESVWGDAKRLAANKRNLLGRDALK
jgi:hypothetical protein